MLAINLKTGLNLNYPKNIESFWLITENDGIKTVGYLWTSSVFIANQEEMHSLNSDGY